LGCCGGGTVSDERKYAVTVEGREREVRLVGAGGDCRASLNGDGMVAADLFVHGAIQQYSLLIDHRSFEGIAERTDDGWIIWVDGEPFELQVIDARLRGLGAGRAAGARAQKATMATPMPGIIVALAVCAGDEVKKGQALLTLEAMKMRNDLKSPRDGRVKEVRVVAGQTVAKGDVLVEFEG
jgi:acetyl/propionyl-CoA carboxylase alpha subunit